MAPGVERKDKGPKSEISESLWHLQISECQEFIKKIEEIQPLRQWGCWLQSSWPGRKPPWRKVRTRSQAANEMRWWSCEQKRSGHSRSLVMQNDEKMRTSQRSPVLSGGRASMTLTGWTFTSFIFELSWQFLCFFCLEQCRPQGCI